MLGLRQVVDCRYPTGAQPHRDLLSWGSFRRWGRLCVASIHVGQCTPTSDNQPRAETVAMAVVVVTGPPCSGKSTHVRTHRKPGDIVIDFDLLAQALGSPNPHDHSAAVRNVTIRMRRAAIEAALAQRDVDVWIVDCNIPPQRMIMYRRAGADIRVMSAPSEVLHERASRERPGLWHGLIDGWESPDGVHAGSREW